MDKIYNIIKTEPINFKKFFDDYASELSTTSFPKTDQDVQRLMGMEGKDTEFEKVKSSISLELLDSPDDVRVTTYVPGISEDKRKTTVQTPSAAVRLNTLQRLIKEKESSQHSPFGKTQYSFKQVFTPTNSADNNMEPFSDIVLSIRFYQPKTDTPLKRRTYPTFSEEFQCLGSNFLSELRDKVSCVCNKKRFFELSDNPTTENPDKLIDPGFFFIEDTFYNDMRNPANPDYSEVIREWAADKTRGFGQTKFKTRRMEEVRFIDLEVSLGFPQLYQHHGNCEHLFTISYVELLSKHTCLVRELYPLLKSVNAYNAKFCNMCGKREYAYVVKNSKRQLHDPAYLCSVCLFSFHYINGKKVDEFSAYRIVSYNEKLDNHESFVVDNLEELDEEFNEEEFGEVEVEVEEEDFTEIEVEVEDDLDLDGPCPAKIKKEV